MNLTQLCNIKRHINYQVLSLYYSVYKIKQEDPLRSYSLVSAIVCLFVLITVLKFVGNE